MSQVCGCFSDTFPHRTHIFDLICVWLLVDLRTNTMTTHLLKENILCLQFLWTTVHAIVNTIGRTYVIHLSNQHTCTSDNYNPIRGGPNSICFLWMSMWTSNFIVHLLPEHKLQEGKLFNRRWRLRKTSHLTPHTLNLSSKRAMC